MSDSSSPPQPAQDESAHWALLVAVALPAVALLFRVWTGRTGSGLLLISLPLMVAVSAIALSVPRMTWFGILGWSFLQYWMSDDLRLLPAWTNLFDDYLLLLLTISWIVYCIHRDRRVEFFAWVGKPITLFLMVAIVSLWANAAPVGPGLFGIRQHMQGALLFLALVNLDFSEKIRRKTVKFVIFCALFQIPVIFVQWLQAGADLSVFASTAGDYLRGTMGGINGNYVGYLSVVAMGLLMGLVYSGYGSQRRLLLMAALLAVPMVMSGARICIPIMALFLVLLYLPKLWRPRYLVAFTVMCSVLLGLILFYYMRFLQNPEDVISLRTNIVAETDPTNVGRFAYYGIAWEVLQDHAAHPLIGTGPATFFSLAGRRFLPQLAVMYNYRMNESSGLPPSAIIAAGVEYGLLGLFAFYWILLNFYLISRRVWRTDDDPFWQGIARGSLALILLFSITPLINNVWEPQQSSYYMWTIPGLLAARLIHLRQSKEPLHDAVGQQ